MKKFMTTIKKNHCVNKITRTRVEGIEILTDIISLVNNLTAHLLHINLFSKRKIDKIICCFHTQSLLLDHFPSIIRVPKRKNVVISPFFKQHEDRV